MRDRENFMEALLKASAEILAKAESGGEVIVECNNRRIRLQHLRSWAFIFKNALKEFPEGQIAGDILREVYCKKRSNADVIKDMGGKKLRQAFFRSKEEIKSFVCAAACQMGIWQVISGREAGEYKNTKREKKHPSTLGLVKPKK